MKELAIANNKFTICETGIDFLEALSFEEWEKLGNKLARVGRSIGMIIGDWINYGEKSYGKTYLEALKNTGFDYATLRDFAYVAKNVELSCRHDNLGFEHHKIVAKLSPEDQRRWLDAAEKHKLSKRRLRKSVILGRIVSIDEMQSDPADKGNITYMVWINRLSQWWCKRIEGDPVKNWDAEDRATLKRDLQPLVDIYNTLSE
ncbi:MAG: hypothetical protein ACFUZC_17060 [Chthoniobacteraceae bacterium]